jgi:large subunit ribosomal protein L25
MKLTASKRTILGKKVSRLRKDGLIPAELYGHGVENTHLKVTKKEFDKIYEEAGEHTIIDLVVDGKDEKIPVLIVQAERHPIKDLYFNIDFHRVRMDEEIHTHVPIEFTGESPGERAGLILIKVLQELEIKTLPGNIPHRIEVSIEGLENAGDTIHINDINLPDGVDTPLSDETVIVSLNEKIEEEEEEVVAPIEGVEDETETEKDDSKDGEESASEDTDKNKKDAKE